MLKRAVTGSVFVATLIFCSSFSSLSLFGLYFIFVFIGSWEYLNILKQNTSYTPNIAVGILSSCLVFTGLAAPFAFELSLSIILPFVLLVLFSIPLIELYANKEHPFSNIVHSIFPSLYVALPFGLVYLLSTSLFDGSDTEYAAPLVLGFYYILWSNDTGAYLSGKAFGKHKLFERISPNKTWEGSIGGATLAITVSLLYGHYVGIIPLWKWAGIGLIISVFGSMGDLVESLFKRSMNVKDSGKIMPGHGGILDRFDGLLIAAPFVFAFLMLARLFTI